MEVPPNLMIQSLGNGSVQVSWEAGETVWRLETSSDLGQTAWLNVDGVVDLGNGQSGVVVGAGSFTGFFRLSE